MFAKFATFLRGLRVGAVEPVSSLLVHREENLLEYLQQRARERRARKPLAIVSKTGIRSPNRVFKSKANSPVKPALKAKPGPKSGPSGEGTKKPQDASSKSPKTPLGKEPGDESGEGTKDPDNSPPKSPKTSIGKESGDVSGQGTKGPDGPPLKPPRSPPGKGSGDASVKSPPKSPKEPPPGPLWEKKNGRDKKGTGRPIIPQGVTIGRISRTWPQTLGTKRPLGFHNGGNDCFQNSMLQCLLHTPAVYNLLGQIHYDCAKSSESCLVCALQKLFQDYWNPTRPSKSSTLMRLEFRKTLLASIPKKGHDLSSWHLSRQDDPMLLLRFLLQRLEEAAKSKTSELFEGRIRRSWKCKHCFTLHRAEQMEMGLVLNIQQPKRQLLAMERYLRETFVEQLELRCDSAACGKRRHMKLDMKHTQTHRFLRTPEVLVVQLNRFTVPQTKDGKHKLVGGILKEVKIKDDVQIPEYLDLEPYCEGKQAALYRLDGIVFHVGDRTTSGHYIAGVRDVSGDGFFSVNDSSVKATNFQALEAGYPDDHGDPYVLIYSKQ
ncbi:hypothetical protein AC579_833 [Pseudocercospora musae]|uniref:USP domain-containing protein n=1 Tax=Pseudocercospora musae TaxID=113226 RepID=A0A139I8Z8_9PEZI|nr:hypothetical protein AC579_833 [Pseudocercospora musae]